MKKSLIIIASCLLLFACQATVNTVENTDKSMQRQAVDTSKISTDNFLRRRLVIDRIDKVELPDGLLKVQVTATNLRTSFWDQVSSWYMKDNPYQIAYRFSWLDENGMDVKTGTQTWIPMTVIPGDTIRIMAVSPNARCKDFTLSIKENQEARSNW